MTQAEFQFFVHQNASWFDGVHPESIRSIFEAEQQMDCLLPPSLKWLLTERGYSESCGVDSLDESVRDTLQARQLLGLPKRYVILNNWHDAGFVLFDSATVSPTGEYQLLWIGAHNLPRLAEGEEMDNDVDVFNDFPAWVVSALESAKEERQGDDGEK